MMASAICAVPSAIGTLAMLEEGGGAGSEDPFFFLIFRAFSDLAASSAELNEAGLGC